MEGQVNTPVPETYFASPQRASEDDLKAEAQAVTANALAMRLLDSIPDLAFVLNGERQIVAANAQVLEALGLQSCSPLLGLRPGELVNCVHAAGAPGGCGTGEACDVCPAVNAILRCLESGQPAAAECRIRTLNDQDGGALDLYAMASPLNLGEMHLMTLVMRDISGDKRRSVLERTFFHDVLNIVAGLRAVAELMEYGDEDPETDEEYRHDLQRMALQLSDEITAQRQLLAAERGELKLNISEATVPDVVTSVVELYRNHSVARDRQVPVGDVWEGEIATDLTLLRRVLGNLVKNALEATDAGEAVTISACSQCGDIIFSVHNPQVIPEDIQKGIFQRSFSTKGEAGRGIGTHSVKLLSEKFLGGKADFSSAAGQGTIFTVSLPADHRTVEPTTAKPD